MIGRGAIGRGEAVRKRGGPGGPREPGAALFLALTAITFVGPLSIHLFLPALPFVRQAFATDTGTAQLSFSLAMLAMAAGTLVFGSLSDRFGRLPALLSGLALFAGGAAAAAFAPSLDALLAARAVQGFGAACGVVVARAVVRDVYGPDRLGQMIAYLTTAYVLAPMLAPPLGGLLIDAFGWLSILALPAAFGLLAIAVGVLIIGETGGETGGESRAGGGARSGLLRGYGRLLGSRRFVLFALNPAFGSGAFFALNTGASHLVIETLGRSAAEFGLYFMLGPLGYMLGNFLAGRLSGRVSGDALVVVGSIVSVLGGLSLAAAVLGFGLGPLSLFAPCGALAIGQGLSMPHAQAAAIGGDPALTGTASGVVVFLQFLFAAGLAQIVGLAFDGTATPLFAAVVGSCVASAGCGCGAALTARRAAARR